MTIDRATAMMLGLALGDALGYPVEFMSVENIRQLYGADGITQPPTRTLYTDDTQMTIAVAEALISDGNEGVDWFMGALGRGFVAWLHLQSDPKHQRAPGNTCIAGIRNYQAGLSWRESGIADSKGCGSAMRVAPIGYFFQRDPQQLKAFALASGIITHRHPAAQAASVAAAYMVKLALDDIPPNEWLKSILDITDGISDEFDAAIYRIGHVEGWTNRDAALQHIGQGWVGEEAVAMALYCLRQHPDDYLAAIRLAANITGDSDSVACIVGGVSGARLGLSAIPQDWQTRCENHDYLVELAQQLTEKRPAS